MKNVKTIISIVMALVMLVSVFPMQVLAETTTIIASGFCGGDETDEYDSASGAYKNLTWTLYEDGTLVIDGKGEMKDYSGASCPWANDYNYKSQLKSLIIKDGVTNIGNNAFYWCGGLTGSLVIPGSVTSIGDGAFQGCEGFTGELVIPNSVTSIGIDAFECCTSLTGILEIPDSVTSIGDRAFGVMSSITEIISYSPYYASSNGILYNSDMTELICFPAGKAGKIEIPNTVKTIVGYAFCYCTKLTGELVIPNSVESIGEYAFECCSGFTGNLTIGNNVTSIGKSAFRDCTGFTGNLKIGDKVTSIGADAFNGCSGFTGDLVIPNNITNIDWNVFENCSGLTGNLVIPDGVTSIGNGSFSGCSGFTGDLIIPASIMSIRKFAFSGCSGLTGIYFKGNAPSAFENRVPVASFPSDTTLYYLDGKTGWTDSEYYDASAGTWNGYKLEKWVTKPSSPIWDGSIATGFARGTGTEADPYIIETAEQLAYLAKSVNDVSYNGEYVKLANDIVLNDTSNWEKWGTEDEHGNIIAPANTWTPIGILVYNGNGSYSLRCFRGTFDGDGHTVSGVYINNTEEYQGLFGYCDGTIKNVGVVDSYIKGNDCVGGVVGRNNSTVTNCYNIGAVSGNNTVGGVVGSGSASNCYNTGTVSGNDYVGGVVGRNNSTVTNCYNIGAVSGERSVGGVVGRNNGAVANCYNIGSVCGNSSDGGVVGENYGGVITSCYYLDTCVTNPTNTYGTPLTDAQMKLQSSYAGWNFENKWEIGKAEDYDYPMLICFGSKEYTCHIVVKDGDTVLSDETVSGEFTINGEKYVNEKFDFLYLVDENGNRYYDGDVIIPTDDVVLTVAWTTRNTSENVWDGSVDTTWAGNGTEESPYLISSAAELAGLAQMVNGGNSDGYIWGSSFEGKYFKLTADIVLNDGGDQFGEYIVGKNDWTPIGTQVFDEEDGGYRGYTFIGTFDGDGHTVSGIYINNEEIFQGLFGYSDGTVKNVGVIDSYIKGGDYVGGVVGSGYTVSNCYNTGTVSGERSVGGVVGSGYGTVTNCYNTGAVSGNYDVGGVVGNNSGNSTVMNCYNTGVVSGNNTVGGVVGLTNNAVTNCYNIGKVNGQYVGGVVGMFSSNIGTVTSCYYLDTCVSTYQNPYGTPLTDTEMKLKENYAGWNFENKWEIGKVKDYDYPTLRCFGSKEYTCHIVVRDGDTVLSDDTVSGGFTINGEKYVNEKFDFLCLVDENGKRYYDGDVINPTDDMVLTVAGAVRNTSENVWDGSIDTKWAGNGTEESPYLISSAAELAGLAKMVNGGNHYEGKFFKLTADIVLNDGGDLFSEYIIGKNEWTPIGIHVYNGVSHDGYDSYRLYPFNGTFDGDDHTVSGIYINSSEEYQGLFGYSDGTVKNVGVVDSYIKGNREVGGVVGYNYGTVTNCYNTGTVSGYYAVGGVVGYIANGWDTVDIVVINCYNTGTVSGNQAVGGVAGQSHGTVTNCYNTGIVNGSNDIGGVVGRDYDGTVTNCYNDGTVNGGGSVGGVVGHSYGNSTITNCYNIGEVSGNYSLGGVVGYSDGTVTSCYYLDTCVPSHANPYGAALTDTEMKDQDSYVGWNFKNTWEFWDGNDYDYPTLRCFGSKDYKYHIVIKDGDTVLSDETITSKTITVDSYEKDGYVFLYLEDENGNRYYEGDDIDLTDDIILSCVWAVRHTTVSVWDGSIATGFARGLGSKKDPYIIETAEQLAYFAKTVNEGVNYSGKYVKLGNDILLNDTTDWENWGKIDENENIIAPVNEWTPIGIEVPTGYGSYSVYEFDGTFDGDGHTVSGIYVNNDKDYQGLFGESYSGTIENVGVIDSYIKGNNRVGGVVGYNGSNSTITNCYNSGTVDGNQLVGGVVGSGSATNCYNTGTVSGGGYVGGVVGSGSATNCYNSGAVSGGGYVGGVIGESNGTVSDCYNMGTVYGNYYFVGGVVGSGGTVMNCYNSGTVNGNQWVGGVAGDGNTVTNCYNTGTVSGNGVVGGVVGESDNISTITNCYNTGKVNGQNVGGVVGINDGTVTNCYNSGAVSGTGEYYSLVGGVVGNSNGTVMNCYNTGEVNGSGDDLCLGGVVGSIEGGTVTNCYNIGSVCGNSSDGGVVGENYGGVITSCYYLDTCVFDTTNTYGTPLTEAQMKLKSSYAGWNFNNKWEIGYFEDYDYPTLICFGSKEYKYHIVIKDRATVLYDEIITDSITVNGDNYKNARYDFAYLVDENGSRYYAGDVIDPTDDMVLTVAWATRNTSENVWDGSVDTTWAGNGTKESPYLISSAAELAGLAQMINDGYYYEGKFFKLTADIVLNDGGEEFEEYIVGKNDWTPIGTLVNNENGSYSPRFFCGTFDGDGHTVSGIYINSREDYQGLFGYCSGATVKNVGVIDSYIKGNDYVGGVVGENYGTVTNCYNTGTVSGERSVGGVVGSGYGTVTNCYNTGAVSGNYDVGGVVGSGSASNCYNTGTVSGNDYVGGVVGRNNSTVTNCYNIGAVSGERSVGGVVGRNNGAVANCYNIGSVCGNSSDGGVVGENYGAIITSCYYLDTCVHNPTNTYGTPLTAAQMKLQSSYVGWNFNNKWEIGYSEDYDYPTLRCFGSRVYICHIVIKDGNRVVFDDMVSGNLTINGDNYKNARYDFAYLVDENGSRYYDGDIIELTDDMNLTVAWATRNTSENVWDGSIDTDWAGNGTEGSPYLISSAAELAGLAQMINDGYYYEGKFFKLTADIVLNDGGDEFEEYIVGKNDWTPIGIRVNNGNGSYSPRYFRGTFDGDGHTVSGIYINSREDYQGLFGECERGTVKNVGVVDSYIKGNDYVGGVVGESDNNSTVTNCYNIGTVSGMDYVGGVVGESDNNSTVTNCYNTGAVSGNYYVGGVVGYGSTVTNCYNTGTVSGSGEYSCVGGVAGGGSTVTNCYNIGTVRGMDYVGGVVGENWNCTVTSCYYLDTCVNNPTNTYGTPLTEAQMRDKNNFVGFDFDEIWTIDPENEDYPYPTLTGVVMKITYTVRFVDKDGTLIEEQRVEKGHSATSPDMSYKTVVEGDYVIAFDRWDGSITNVQDDITVTAVYRITEIIRFIGTNSEINIPKGYYKDDLRVTIESYYQRKLFTTTNGYKMMCEVEWNEEDFNNIDTNVKGTYKISGIIKITDERYSEFAPYYDLAEGQSVTVTVNVDPGEEQYIFQEGDLEYKDTDDGNGVIITGYSGASAEIKIPGTIDGKRVVGIDDSSFKDNDKVQIVKLPDSVEWIGESAFENCTSLVMVYLNEGLETIGKRAFFGTSLVCVTLPESLKSIREKAIAYYSEGDTVGGFVIYLYESSCGIEYANSNGITYSVLKPQVDESTGIETNAEEGVTLFVAETTEGEYYESAQRIIQETGKISLFEIKLVDEDNKETQPRNILTMSIPVPDTFRIEKCKIYRINDDGSYKDMEAIIVNGKLVFTTAHLSYYAIVEEGSGITLSGKVTSYNPNNAVTVELRQGDTVKYTTTIAAAASDEAKVTQAFTLTDVAPGTYDLVVTKAGHLDYTVTDIVVENEDIDLTASEKAYSDMKMIAGDIDGNGHVNSSDWSILWGDDNYLKATESAKNKLADIDGNGHVNSSDWSILWADANYLKGKENTTFAY